MNEATCATAAIADDRLRAALAFGDESTMEQDMVFAFRILVDIALEADPAWLDGTETGVMQSQARRPAPS